MKTINLVIFAACIATASPVFAEYLVITAAGEEIDCDQAQNIEKEACLATLDEGISNFVPLVAPAAGLLLDLEAMDESSMTEAGNADTINTGSASTN